MTGTAEIFGTRVFVYQFTSRVSAFDCGNARCRVDMVDRDGESCFVIIRILCYHRRKAQLACIFTADRHADKPFAVAGHEIHVFRCTELCGTDEIAFIFSVRIVRDDNHMSCAKFFQSLFYSIVLVFLLCHYRKPPIKKP